MNALPESTGTEAPLTIVPIGGGKLAFMSPLGLRTVDLNGTVSQPIGVDGQGITQPFQYAVAPSQMCAAYNVGVYRVSVQNGLVMGEPYQEYWLDIPRGIWHGPHTFPSRLIQPWRNSFVVAPVAIPASLWVSDAYATTNSNYTENGTLLSWETETVLLPDNQAVAMNAMVEANLTGAMTSSDLFVVIAFDEDGGVLDTISVLPGVNPTKLRERGLFWSEPIIFKQMSISVAGNSTAATRIGNHYMRHEILGYSIDEDEDDAFFLLAEDGVTLLLAEDGTTPLTPG